MKGRRIPLIVALAALAFAGRMAFIAIPGVSLSYLVVFIAGVGFGPLVGLGVAAIARCASDLAISGLNPILLPMVLVEATLGLLAGFVGKVFDLGQRGRPIGWVGRSVLANLALVFTALYSVTADTFTWVFFQYLLPGVATVDAALWSTLVLLGLAFNAPAIAFNVLLFPTVVPAILRGLHEAGLLPERAPRNRPVPPMPTVEETTNPESA